ncbi:hypothetical protein Q2941_27570 [Bradyrhizobium sp. UFLA05-153]
MRDGFAVQILELVDLVRALVYVRFFSHNVGGRGLLVDDPDLARTREPRSLDRRSLRQPSLIIDREANVLFADGWQATHAADVGGFLSIVVGQRRDDLHHCRFD